MKNENNKDQCFWLYLSDFWVGRRDSDIVNDTIDGNNKVIMVGMGYVG